MFEYDFTVQYVDIDYQNQLSDYGVMKYLQETACLHADSCKYGLNDTFQTRLAWIILDWKIKILHRPQWKSNLHVKTWISKIDSICCYRDFEITSEDGNTVAIATSKWILLNIDSHRISKIEPDINNAFQPVNKSIFNEDIEKIQEPLSYQSYFEYKILRRDIDTNNHLNNLNYVLLAKQALPEHIYNNNNITQIQVSYKHQCLLNDEFLFCYSCISENEHIVSIKNKLTNVTHAMVRFIS